MTPGTNACVSDRKTLKILFFKLCSWFTSKCSLLRRHLAKESGNAGWKGPLTVTLPLSKFKSWTWISHILPGYKLQCRFVWAWNNSTGFRLGWIYSERKENLALIFQLFLLTRIISQFEIQLQCCTLEFKAKPIWALSRILFYCLKERNGGKRCNECAFTCFQLGNSFEAIFEA